MVHINCSFMLIVVCCFDLIYCLVLLVLWPFSIYHMYVCVRVCVHVCNKCNIILVCTSLHIPLQVIRVMSYSLEVYLQVLVVNMALNQTWIALLIFVLCAFPGIAFRLSPVISSVAGFASGFFIPRESMPPW